MHGVTLTPTQRAAHERSRAFRERIATLALKLQVQIEAPVPKIVAEPEAEPLPALPPLPSIVYAIERVDPWLPSVARVQKAVCRHFDVSLIDLKSPCRERRVAHPRMIAMYLCRDLTTKSFPEIGRRFGGRDHTTALHSYQKIRAKVQSDETFAAEIAKLKERLA